MSESEKLTAESVYQHLTNTGDLERMRENIRDMFDNFVTTNDTSDAEDRSSMYHTYKTLDTVLQMAIALDK